MPVDTRDYYADLGVPRNARREEVRRAYRNLARLHHPDVNREPGAEERFKVIAEAYHVLSDPKRRREYDASHASTEQDAEDWLGSLFRDAPPGQRRPPHDQRRHKGADIEAGFAVSVEDAYHGGRRTVTLPGPAGRPRQYTVDVPAGVAEGQRIRLTGLGGAGGDGGPPGDLVLVVHLSPHPRYKVHGRDVVLDLPVTPWEAALGAAVPVRMPGGRMRVDVPAGSSSGRRLRLRGQGLPDPRGTAGDLYVEVRIVVPPDLSGRERRLYEQLAAASTTDPRRTA
jgi:curved DNA-binding protein